MWTCILLSDMQDELTNMQLETELHFNELHFLMMLSVFVCCVSVGFFLRRYNISACLSGSFSSPAGLGREA